MDPTFRQIVHAAAHRFVRGHIQWSVSVARKHRGNWRSTFTVHEHKDAIARRSGKNSWEITLPSGITWLKQEDSKHFALIKIRPITERSYKILLRKRSAHPSTTI